MYKERLVNIITPSYNSAHLITRLLDSVVKQTYPQVEMFVIDDGSTDNTEEVIQSYIPRFEERGYQLHYVYQENGGQSAAINNGLKLVTGEFLTWPDADDWYKTNDAIVKMVRLLKESDDSVGIARCQMEYVEELTGTIIHTTDLKPCDTPCKLMDDAIFQVNDFFYAPIGWIAKAKFLDEYISNREIYVHKYAGQNAQMLLPYLANSKCITCADTLACYLVRNVSSSHQQRDYDKQFLYYYEHLNAFIVPLTTIKNIDDKKRVEYLRARKVFYYRHYLDLDYMHSRTKEFRKHYKEAKKLNMDISKMYSRLYCWTSLFSIESYKKVGKLKNRICKRFKKK